jgi:hypothetical protein
VEQELQAFHTENLENNRETENEEFYSENNKTVTNIKRIENNNDLDGDEGFYDKLDPKMDQFTSVSLIASH